MLLRRFLKQRNLRRSGSINPVSTAHLMAIVAAHPGAASMQTRSTRVHGDETPGPSSAWTSAFAAEPVPQPRTRRGRSTREFCRRSRPTSRSGCDLLQSCGMRSAGERPPAHGQDRPDAPARPSQRPTYPAGRQWNRSHRGHGSIDRLAIMLQVPLSQQTTSPMAHMGSTGTSPVVQITSFDSCIPTLETAGVTRPAWRDQPNDPQAAGTLIAAPLPSAARHR